MEKRIRRAQHKARTGYFRRGVQALTNAPLCTDTTRLRRILVDKHPSRIGKPELPSAPLRPHIIIDPDLLRKIFKRIHNGSAPAISGWNADLLEPVMQDEECFAAIVAFVEAAANNNLPEPARQLILQKTLMAPAKPNKTDSPQPEDPRPVTILEPLYQLAASYCLSLVDSALSDILQPLGQFGIGTRGGCELALHRTQADIEDSGPMSAVLLDDKINCFNSIDRRDILKNLYATHSLQNLWGIADMAYGRPSVVVYKGEHSNPLLPIWCEEGSQQGCSLGTALCCLGLIPVNNALTHNLNASINSICDDSAITCPKWEDTLCALDRSLSNTTVQVSRSKTKILWPHTNAPPQGLVEGCQQRGVRLVLESTKHLGGIIGCNPERISEHAMHIAHSHDHFFEAICHPAMSKQIATGFLRISGANRFNYLSRTQPPRLIYEAANRFDTAKLQAFKNINQIPDSHALDFTTTTLIYDTLGIQQTAKNITQAYYAASINAIQHNKTASLPSSNLPPRLQHLQDCWTRLSEDLPTADSLPRDDSGDITSTSLATLPTTFTALPTFYAPAFKRPTDRPKIQRAISISLRLQRMAYLTLPANNPTHTIARIHSITSKHALAWYRVIPNSPRTTLNDHQWIQAIHYILNAPLHPNLHRCICGYDYSQPSASNTHAHTCAKFRKTLVNMRHDLIAHVNANQCNSLGITATVEFNTTDDASRKRPDLIAYFDTGHHLVDTTISEPTANSHLKYALRPGILLQTMQNSKRSKYADLAKFEGATFSTNAMEGMGAFGPEFLIFIDRIVKHATDNLTYKALASTPKTLRAKLIAEISCSLMKGNARIRSRATQISIAAQTRTRSNLDINHSQLLSPTPAHSSRGTDLAINYSQLLAPAQPHNFKITNNVALVDEDVNSEERVIVSTESSDDEDLKDKEEDMDDKDEEIANADSAGKDMHGTAEHKGAASGRKTNDQGSPATHPPSPLSPSLSSLSLSSFSLSPPPSSKRAFS